MMDGAKPWLVDDALSALLKPLLPVDGRADDQPLTQQAPSIGQNRPRPRNARGTTQPRSLSALLPASSKLILLELLRRPSALHVVSGFCSASGRSCGARDS
jgi:hypothetical protein